MTRIASNHLLLATVGAIFAYWLASLVIPGEVMSSASSLFLLIFGSVTSLRYSPQAYQILVNRERNDAAPDGDGSHLAVYGVSLLANGSVYVGLFGLLWMAMGQPSTWLATAASGFGRAVMGAGFALLFFSPDVSRKGLRLPAGLWLFAAAAIALGLAFVFGVKVGQSSPVFVRASYAERTAQSHTRVVQAETKEADLCALLGNPNSGVYHDRSSMWRLLMRGPKPCFDTVEEARVAGYRPPR